MTAVWIILGIVVLILLWGVVSYNRFISQRNLIRDSWANIDTELRRRYDLIPNLVETVRGYAGHERQTLEAVIQARNAAVAATGSPQEQAQAENVLVGALRQLFALSESYPTLRANENFLALQAELTNTEDRLQTSRRFYNGNVREYNQRVKSVPSNVIASMFKFEEEEFFEVEEAIREAGPPQVDFTTPPAVGGPPATSPAPPPPAPQSPPAAPAPSPPPQGSPPGPGSTG
ncbi:MAG: LemA family protein [Actinobacteria bacterium]|nr:LemA family protein [Actinomycetota bacterium]